jgi:hypothetical protein
MSSSGGLHDAFHDVRRCQVALRRARGKMWNRTGVGKSSWAKQSAGMLLA